MIMHPVNRAALRHTLRSVFHHEEFRAPQEDVIVSILSGRDVVVLMPTGGGKSLTYQLPAVHAGCCGVIISPLVALIQDQVQAARAMGIAASCLWSGASSAIKETIFEDLESAEPRIRLLYATPEGVRGGRLLSALSKLQSKGRLGYFAIDECHQISAWGHQFRPAYRELGALRTRFPSIPILALTATATQAVVSDIKESLGIERATVYTRSFDRPNLAYTIAFKDLLGVPPLQDLQMQLRTALGLTLGGLAPSPPPRSLAIVYAQKREEVDRLAADLTRAGIPTVAYHAGLSDAARSAAQEEWMRGIKQVCVATIAFGMGIDAPRVRFVAHWTCCASVPGYYQEAGRAGRDGAPATCRLYYSRTDSERLLFLERTSAQKAAAGSTSSSSGSSSSSVPVAVAPVDATAAIASMIEFCETPQCRRVALLAHFGEKPPYSACPKSSSQCDYCLDSDTVASNSAVVRTGMRGAALRQQHADATEFAARVSAEEQHLATLYDLDDGEGFREHKRKRTGSGRRGDGLVEDDASAAGCEEEDDESTAFPMPLHGLLAAAPLPASSSGRPVGGTKDSSFASVASILGRAAPPGAQATVPMVPLATSSSALGLAGRGSGSKFPALTIVRSGGRPPAKPAQVPPPPLQQQRAAPAPSSSAMDAAAAGSPTGGPSRRLKNPLVPVSLDGGGTGPSAAPAAGKARDGGGDVLAQARSAAAARVSAMLDRLTAVENSATAAAAASGNAGLSGGGTTAAVQRFRQNLETMRSPLAVAATTATSRFTAEGSGASRK